MVAQGTLARRAPEWMNQYLLSCAFVERDDQPNTQFENSFAHSSSDIDVIEASNGLEALAKPEQHGTPGHNVARDGRVGTLPYSRTAGELSVPCSSRRQRSVITSENFDLRARGHLVKLSCDPRGSIASVRSEVFESTAFTGRAIIALLPCSFDSLK